MYRTLLISIAIVVAVGVSCAAATVQEIVNLVSQASYQSYLETTIPTGQYDNRAFDFNSTATRALHGPQHDIAAANIFVAFRRSGWLTYFDPFTYNDDAGKAWSGRSVIAIKQGTTRPNDIYIVSSHYDSTANHEATWTYAPGANDNASGTAGLLEMARIMAPYSFGATVVLCAFDGEEVSATVGGTDIPRLGSMHYATTHASDNMKEMVSFDMISWFDGTNTGRIETGYSQNTSINSEMRNALQNYGGLSTYTNNSSNFSDHVSFATLPSKVPAIMLIESGWWPNDPYYHTHLDSINTVGNVNYPYATKMLKSVCGWLCGQAGVTGGP